MSTHGGGAPWGPQGGPGGPPPYPGPPYPGPYGPPPGGYGPRPGPPPPGWGPYPPPPPGPRGPYGPNGPGPWPPPPPRPSLTRRQKIVRFVFNPFFAAHQVFLPSRPGRVEDSTVRKLQIWRTVLGLAVWVWLMVTYNAISEADDVKTLADDRFNQTWYSIMALICTFPVIAGAFVFAARPRLRRVYLRRALRSLGAVLALVASVFSFVLGAAPEFQGLRDFVGLFGKIVGGVVILWSLGFALYGMLLSLVHVFRTADVHELLPPILVTFLVWEMAAVDLIVDSYVQVPPLVRLAFILGTPVTVTALSGWEMYRLRRHHGLTLRGALGR